jgi:serine protease Do
MKRSIAIAACLLVNAIAVSPLAAESARHGYLGVGVANLTDERVKELKLKDSQGVVVMNVGDDTPAAHAGIKASDVIVEFDGQRIHGVDQFMHVVRETPPNRKVTIRVIRAGAAQTLNATLTAQVAVRNEDYFELQMPPMPRTPWDEVPPVPFVFMPPMPQPVLAWRQTSIGIEGEALTGQLAEYFGVKEGVLVRSVLRNSPAEKAGLKAGDVIVRVAATAVKSPQSLSREVASLVNDKTPVTLTAVRNRRETSFALKLSTEDAR